MMDTPKIHKFVERNLVKGDRFIELKCPCCNYQCQEYWSHYTNFLWHLINKIRVSGDIPHMRLLIKLFGKEYSMKLFKKWAKQSRIVYKNLKKIITENER